MTRTVIGVFSSQEAANNAVRDLRDSGFSREISVLAKDNQQDEAQGKDAGLNMTNDMDTLSNGAATGGMLGGLAGLAVGAGALAIPGLGPLIAAGPIAGVLSGAATGGLAGGLIDWGIPEQEGRRYEQDVRQGKILAAVRTTDDRVNQAAGILRHYGGENVKVH